VPKLCAATITYRCSNPKPCQGVCIHPFQTTATPANTEAPSEPEPPQTPAHYCQAHQTAFKRYERDGRVWYSHKAPDGKWCKGK
jgi:hypothetical protein